MDPKDDDVDLIQWAKDVLFAVERIRKTTPAPNPKGRPPKEDVTKRPDGVTERQFELWRIGRESPDMLTKTMFPRAFSILAGERDKENHEEIVIAEQRSIKEMKAILAEALAEALGNAQKPAAVIKLPDPLPEPVEVVEDVMPWDVE